MNNRKALYKEFWARKTRQHRREEQAPVLSEEGRRGGGVLACQTDTGYTGFGPTGT